MHHRRIVIAVLLLTLVLSLVACQGATDETTTATDDWVPETALPYVSMTGKVLPVSRALLAPVVGGTITSVAITEGQQVKAGELLLEIDNAQPLAAVAQAQAAVDAAEAALALVEAGATQEQVAAAQAAVDLAESQVQSARLAAALAQHDVTAAEAGLQASQAALDLATNGATPEELEIARQQVEQAKAQLYSLQGQRDAVGGTKGKPGYQGGSYEAAEGQVLAAENAVTIAKLNQTLIADGSREEQLRMARADVDAAKAMLHLARDGVASAEQAVVVAEVGAAQARAQLDVVRAPATVEQIAQAQAQVQVAQASLRAAEAAAALYSITAPIDGTVTRIDVREGEFVSPGQPIISIGRLDRFIVETTDLDEMDVARVRVGAPATIAFDALPSTVLDGTVESIALQAGAGSGGTTYQATIRFLEHDPALLWGMTAFVDVVTE